MVLNRTADGILRDIESSLKEFGADSIDLYQNHGVRNEADYRQIISPGGALDGMLKISEMASGIIEKARECTQCGECEPRCPYELPIPELLQSTVAWSEKEIAQNQ